MAWNHEEYVKKLHSAIAEKRSDEVRMLIGAFQDRLDKVGTYDKCAEIMELLRSAGLFRHLLTLGEDLSTRSPDVKCQCYYAQALIENGQMTDALALLEHLRTEEADSCSDFDESEIVGLMGRAYKQLFIDAKPNHIEPRVYDFEKALHFYTQMYEKDPIRNYWHGINVVALLHWASSLADDRKSQNLRKKEIKIANDLLVSLEARMKKAKPFHWELATALEASIALEKWPLTRKYLNEYIEHEKVDLFALHSTLRQLRQVWAPLSPTNQFEKEFRRIMRRLQSALLSCKGASLSLSHEDLDLADPEDREYYEKNFTKEVIRTIQWFELGLTKARAVGLIGKSYEGSNISATAFLVSPCRVLTCWHVVPGKDGDFKAGDAKIEFSGMKENGRRLRRRVKDSIVWSGNNSDLDATLLELDQPVPSEYHASILSMEDMADSYLEEGNRAYIIGHPGGGPQKISLHDSKIIASDSKVIQYRTPTERGSSGSPVFAADDWSLIGLHQCGHKRMRKLRTNEIVEANQAVRIDRIWKALKRARAL